MIRVSLGISLVALAVAAASWALPGPVVTRGSAALPTGCDPAAVAALVAGRAGDEGQNGRVRRRHPESGSAAGPGRVPRRARRAEGRIRDSRHRRLLDAGAPHVGRDPSGRRLQLDRPVPGAEGLAVSGPTVACAGLPTAWETSDDFTVKSVAQRAGLCGAVRARASAISVLRALNYGKPTAFAAAFLPKGRSSPTPPRSRSSRSTAGRRSRPSPSAGSPQPTVGRRPRSVGPLERTKNDRDVLGLTRRVLQRPPGRRRKRAHDARLQVRADP